MRYEDIDILRIPILPLDNPRSGYPGFNPHTEILPEGYRLQEGRRPLPCQMICQQDVTITMRDGTKLYADIYRPVDQEAVPAILCWGAWGTGYVFYAILADKKTDTVAGDTGVIRNYIQVFVSAGYDSLYKGIRNAAGNKAGNHDGHAVRDMSHGICY